MSQTLNYPTAKALSFSCIFGRRWVLRSLRPQRRSEAALWALAGLLATMLPGISLAGPAGSAVQTGDLLTEAERAAREGVTEVSIIKLEQYLRGSPDPASTASIYRAKLLLAEDFLNVRRGNEAMRVLADPDLPEPEADFLRARASLRLQHWDAAAEIYSRLLQIVPDAGHQERARLGLAAARYGARNLDGAL
jgi:hypothetical protein